MTLLRRSFYHYESTWYHCLINPEKLFPLVNPVHKNLREFIYGVIIPEKVPNEYFHKGADRCFNAGHLNCKIVERPSRYRNIIKQALENRGDKQAHYVVEKALVESPETKFVISEVPVWLPQGVRVGHIDVIELAEGNPSIVVWDYKPRSNEHDASGQLSMYAVILAKMINVPLQQIQIGWFDEVSEVLVVE